MEDSSGNDDLKYPGWQKPLLEAVLELDAHKSKARVAAAEITICNRLETLSPGHDHHAERQALDDALRTLRILKMPAHSSQSANSIPESLVKFG